MITFSERFIFVQENSNLIINVHRINGHDGDVSVRCRSLQQTAESGTDFLGGEQILSFHDQVVEVWEGLVTVLLFPLLVISAYLTEKRGCPCLNQTKTKTLNQNGNQIIDEPSLQQSEPGMITFSERFIFVQENSNLIINVHRINGHDGDVSVRCRSLQQTAESGTDFLGGEQILSFHDQVVEVWEGLVTVLLFPLLVISAYLTEKRGCPCLNQTKTKTLNQNGNQIIDEPSLQQSEPGMITFSERFIFVQENSNLIINVHRINGHDGDVSVRCRSLQQTAESGTDFLGGEQILSFHDQVVEVWEGLVTVLLFPLLVISAYLTEKRGCPCLNQTKTKTLNQNGNQIIDEPSLQQSEPGMITFSERFIFVQENSNLIINVHRINGHDGDVSVRCRSLQQTAESGTDFLGGEQILSFHDQVGKISVPIQIMMTERNFNRVFEIELSEPGGGATIGPIPRMAVSIKHDDAFTELMKNRIPTSTYLREFRMHNQSLFSRIRDAVIVNDGDTKNATAFDWSIHVFAVVWKVEVWEGLVTVLLFPLLVISAYLTEKRGCPCLNQTKTKTLNQNGNQIIDEPSLQQSEPGMITFSERFIFVQENSNLIINVHRINGHDGDVSVRCRSLQQTAESGTDFLGGEQILSFHDQVVKDEYSTDIDLGRGGWGKMVQQKAETS
ncbi:uncharacterized protein LOC136035389 isoform X2 [Artemia franciscana]|uniref:uncharacterized protein LOC136035389 isoform X2 n=1 Tax=Artemia franciscana TaxID=6661 RepID=UPI0032DA7546